MTKRTKKTHIRLKKPPAGRNSQEQTILDDQSKSGAENSGEPPRFDVEIIRKLEQSTGILKKEISEGTFGFDRGKNYLIDTAKNLVRQLHQIRQDAQLSQLVDEATPWRLNYLRALTWCAECFDYFGRAGSRSPETPATLIEEEASRIRLNLDQRKPLGEMERAIAREEMWILLHSARAWYRRHDYEKSLQDLQAAEDFVEDRLEDKRDFPCRLTLATLWCAHAHVLRQQAHLSEATSFYERAISRIREVFEDEGDRRRTRVLMETGRALGLGLGWILYTRGSLTNARAMIAAGLVCLDQTDDRVHKAYAKLLLGCIRRAEAGFEAAGLTEAIKLMDEAYDQLASLGHDPYLARANYEMALAYLYRAVSYSETYLGPLEGHPDSPDTPKELARADFREAEKHLERLEKYAGTVAEPRDPRWLSNALVVRSRLERDRGKYFALGLHLSSQAKPTSDRAAQALAVAQKHHQTFCEMDARIAVAESRILGGQILGNETAAAEVKGHLDEVIRLANGNPKVLGVARLHYTRYFLALRDLDGAKTQFQEWSRYTERVQHGLIHHLAKKVEVELRKLESECLVIDTRRSLRLPDHARSLLDFLVGRAQSKHPKNVTQQAHDLDIAPATYEGWLEKLKDPSGVRVILEVKKPENSRSRAKTSRTS